MEIEKGQSEQRSQKKRSQPKQSKKTGIKILMGFAVFAIVALGVYLFVGDQIIYYLQLETEILSGKASSRGADEQLVIGYAFPHTEYDPTFLDPASRDHLIDIYEGLVKTDRNLNVEPALAISWGLTDPLTWEFKLRKGVKFHNGEDLETADVVASIERAIKHESSQLKNLLSTVEDVFAVDDEKIRIVTNVSDALMLQKLALTLIHPRDFDKLAFPTGTGPYKFLSGGEDGIKMEAFDDYWGVAPAFKNVYLQVIPGRRARIEALEKGEMQFLVNFPPTVGCSLFESYKNLEGCKEFKNKNIIAKAIPGLEVSFIAFNFDHELFGDNRVRQAVSKALDPWVLVDISFGFASPASQFVSSGVFGFNPDLKETEYNMEMAKKLMQSVIGDSFERIEVTFDYPEALLPIGEYVQDQMKQLGVDVVLNPMHNEELQRKIISGQSDFYYLGWRSELGDAQDFLKAVAHSQDMDAGAGLFNGMNYSNELVDQLIDEAEGNHDLASRAKQLQQAMKIIVEDDVIGVPLFEAETLYGFSKDIQFEPRVDGQVFSSSIK